MTLTKEQIHQLKRQLLEQIKNLPKEQRQEAEKQIDDLSDESIEEMLESQKTTVRIFRDIVSRKIPSKRIGENDKGIAVLDIKPLSRGHTIIIPKEKLSNLDKMPTDISIFIDEISKKLLLKLNPKNIKIIPEIKFDEAIINLIPIYEKDLTLESERLEVSEQDLEKIIELINKKEEKIEEDKGIKKEELKKFKRRIP